MTVNPGMVAFVGHNAEQLFTQNEAPLSPREVLAMNASLQRAYLARRLEGEGDTRRSINDECGYPDTGNITEQDYRDLYDREPLATRVVEVLPKESWQGQPELVEDEKADNDTEFEVAWDELGQNLREEESWFQHESLNPIWEYLLRADILCGVGRYGCLLLGVDDGKELDEPLEPSKGMELLYLRPFDESLSQITRYETDKKNRRFGQPNMYSLTFNHPNDISEQDQGHSLASDTANVHWSRVVHYADNLGTSDIFGPPRMQCVYNRLVDLRKLYGGSAEMFWRGAFPGISIETHPQLGGDVVIDSAAMKAQMEQYMNGLQRYMSLVGQTANSLAPQVVDPTNHINAQIDAICIRLGIPKRIFMGSERGELASSQDDSTWNDRLRHRQSNFITPRIIVPFVNRLIWSGILPSPESYSVKWPDLEALTETEQSTIAVQKTEAMSKYVSGSCESIMTPIDFWTRIIGLEQEEAESIVDEAVKVMEEQEEQDALEREEQLKQAEEMGIPQAPSVEGFQNVPQPEGMPGVPPAKKKPKVAFTDGSQKSKPPTKNVVEIFHDLKRSVPPLEKPTATNGKKKRTAKKKKRKIVSGPKVSNALVSNPNKDGE